ncbi:ThuA domain-containing protein [Frankia sp. CNm7]|nr:ThuA domain-containing protein [Frankia nepalensis]MBL7513709.1 ThuA domain-containing protein [Frankia nepalensis]MBL7523456.1 ThuA domain-containing protein [Frankia nepalensis]
MDGSRRPPRVLVWGENVHDQEDHEVRQAYPLTMHETIAAALRRLLGERALVETATLQEPDHGLSSARVAEVDVLLWWGHVAHDVIADEVVDRLQRRVQQGMGLIVLHSGHLSKIFRRLMGTNCHLRWREGNDREILWPIMPGHPILRGISGPIVLPAHEMYGEPFNVPAPDSLLFISNFSGGEVFRSGMCWTRGQGKVFYFSPGHETHPVYHHPEVQLVLANAVQWCAPSGAQATLESSLRSPEGWFERETT